MVLANFLEKNQRFQHQIQAVTLKITSYTTVHNFFDYKKIKIKDFVYKTNFFLGTLLLSPRAILATWLHLGALQNYMKNKHNKRKLK